MIEKFAGARDFSQSEFLDLNHTSRPVILVSLMIPKFARNAGGKVWQTSGRPGPLRLRPDKATTTPESQTTTDDGKTSDRTPEKK